MMKEGNIKTPLKSEPPRSISDILQSAVYRCCPPCPLQLSCLVRGFNSISQNRKNIFFIALRQDAESVYSGSALFLSVLSFIYILLRRNLIFLGKKPSRVFMFRDGFFFESFYRFKQVVI